MARPVEQLLSQLDDELVRCVTLRAAGQLRGELVAAVDAGCASARSAGWPRAWPVAQRRAGPVGDHVGHLGRMAPAVAPVDVLDHLLAPTRLDIHVDVGRAVSAGDKKRSKSRPRRTASALVIPSE